MGRIRTRWIKNLAEDLVKNYPDKFGKDFETNKKVLDELKVVDSKKTRNKLAGYIINVLKNKRF